MKKRWILIIICLILSSPITIFSQRKIDKSKTKNKAKKEAEEFKSPFRYIIVSGVTEIEKYSNNDDGENFSMVVLIEDKAFNEKNLRILYNLLDKRFNQSPGLYVEVYTSLNAIRTPEEYEHINNVGPIDNYFKYKWAFFIRNGYGKWFEYGIPKIVEEKRVEIGTCETCD
jgi:hypothetical protein